MRTCREFINSIISIIKAESVEIKELDGFTIQIYLGDDRLMAQSVVINGVSFDSAGVRFKGNSSYQPNNIKNPL